MIKAASPIPPQKGRANQLLAFLAAKVKYKKAPDEYSMSLFTKLVFYI